MQKTMDSIDLLAREEEFRKLNKQLNKKTESLMKEIEQAMQKPDVFTDFSHSLILNSNHKIKKHNCHSPSKSSLSSNPSNDGKSLNKINRIKQCKRISFEAKSDSNETNIDPKNKIIEENNSRNGEENSKNTSASTHSKDKNSIIKYNNSYLDVKEVIGNSSAGDGIKESSEYISKEAIESNNSDSKSEDIDQNIDNDDEGSAYDDNRANEDVIIKPTREFHGVCDCCDGRSKRDDSVVFLHAFVNLIVKDNVLPKSFLRGNNITVESVCKCLSSKIKLLQEQMDGLQSAINKKKTQCEAHLTHLAELESERMSLLNKTNSMTSSVAEMRAKSMALQKRLEEKDRLYKEQRSEADKLSSELKRLKSKSAGVEAKCASQEEAIGTLKQQLEVARRAEKELKDTSRVVSASQENAISRLEAQIKALTTRNEKQMALINNLRKQNAILAAEGALKALEKDYSEFLCQDFE